MYRNRIVFILSALLFVSYVNAQPTGQEPGKKDVQPRQISQPKPAPAAVTEKPDPVTAKAMDISKRLKLDGAKSKSVYNIVSQTEKRLNDLQPGTENYAKLAGYINEERNEMLKSALSQDEYKEYQKSYTSKDFAEIGKLVSKNNQFVSKKMAQEKKEKMMAEKIMLKDKANIAKAEKAQKIKDQKEADKQKMLAKKEADKLKITSKKEADKQKAADKKIKDSAKKENDKQKALAKREADKQKATAKKEADKQKVFEAKQKQMEKKIKDMEKKNK